LLGRAERPIGLRREDYLSPKPLRDDYREQEEEYVEITAEVAPSGQVTPADKHYQVGGPD
jgi:hypothetical protein